MKKFLALSAENKLQDRKAEHTIYLEKAIYEECKVKRNHIIQEYIGEIWDENNYEEAHRYVYELSDRILESMVESLNNYHKIEFENRQWNIILGLWMKHFLFALLDRFMKVSQIEGDNVYTYALKNVKLIYPNYFQSTGKLVGDDDFNAYLYSTICEFKGIKVKKSVDFKDIINQRNRKKYYQEFIKIITGTKKMNSFFKSKDSKGSDSDIFDCSEQFYALNKDCKILLIRTFLPQELENSIIDVGAGKIESLNISNLKEWERTVDYDCTMAEESRRMLLEKFEPQNKFERYIKQIIPMLLPICYVERFAVLYSCAKQILGNSNVERIYTAGLIGTNLPTASIVAALAQKNGAKIIDIQHSAMYNANKTIRYFETQIFDEFITWGWNDVENPYGNIHPLAYTRICKHICDKEKTDNYSKILYVTGVAERYETGVGFSDNQALDRKKSFIKCLDTKVRNRLVIRTRSRYDEFYQYIKCNYTDVKLETMDDCTMQESMNESGLVICDYNSTPFYEALISNKPVVLYEGIKYRVKNQCMERWEQKLEKEFIYFSEAKLLADRLKEFGSNNKIALWWEKETTKKVVQEYMEYFTRMSCDVRQLWMDECIHTAK